ncbi:hypothetical protein [Azotobacter beijerinckii]|uniref:hypothetical protein n=1 Tax=Azotobacter beijerinckii TaxID=170623 RepID=UPI002954D6DC|nr:hypothetical protein [Azotobacter beijerinckii]MDV7213519.1 hypothetical protein [Azotobacter beijerinckii]
MTTQKILKAKVLFTLGLMFSVVVGIMLSDDQKPLFLFALCVLVSVLALYAPQHLRVVLLGMKARRRLARRQATRAPQSGCLQAVWCSSDTDYERYLAPTFLRQRQEETAAQDVRPQADQGVGEFIARDESFEQPAACATEAVEKREKALEKVFDAPQESVTGIYCGSGFAPYRFHKKNPKSFFLRIGKHLVWGIELHAALRQSGVRQGQEITLTFHGKTPVKVLKTKRVNGVVEQDWADALRNAWSIEAVQ